MQKRNALRVKLFSTETYPRRWLLVADQAGGEQRSGNRSRVINARIGIKNT